MHKTKIDWADCTSNPITGCLHDCEYCYARKQTVRFSGDIRLNMADERCKKYEGSDNLFVLDIPFTTRNERSISYPFGFAPTLHKYRLDDFEKRRAGTNIFVCSMADMFGEWVPDEWIQMIFEACKKHTQHNYMFLTKNPSRYLELAKAGKLPKDDNMWYGTTITTKDEEYFYADDFKCFLSIEPIFEDFGTKKDLTGIDWIIVGAETGKRKGKVIPDKSWIANINKICKDNDIPLFMKDSLTELMGDNFIQQFPKQLSKEKSIGAKKEKMLMTNCMECNKHSKKAKMQSITIRKGRNGRNKTIGCICDDCFGKLAEKWGVDIEGNERN